LYQVDYLHDRFIILYSFHDWVDLNVGRRLAMRREVVILMTSN